jgi:diguanylate cyclase
VTSMLHERRDFLIVESTIKLARSLGYKVVAEGVESAELLQVLAENDCDEAQGYHISRPLTASGFNEWMNGRRGD